MKKIFILASFVMSLATALLVGVVGHEIAQVAYGVSLSPVAIGTTFFVVRALWSILTKWDVSGLALAGVNREIWTDKLKENFYSNYDWLAGIDDWSEWVEFNTINFTIIGTNPVILKNNATWPIVAAQRTDTNGTVVLDTYDSTTTRVRRVEEIEAAINKLESVVKYHRQSLIQEIVTECMWNMTPLTIAAGNIAVTGANRAAVIGSQSSVAATLTIADIAGLQERWDALDYNQEGRVLILNPYHRSDLMRQDALLFKQFTDLKNGQPLPLFGIDIYTSKNTPVITKSTGAKPAYAAAADNTNDCVASVAFSQKEVMKAMGDVQMFYRTMETNPEQRSDEVGFQMRFKGIPTRTTNFFQQCLFSNRA